MDEYTIQKMTEERLAKAKSESRFERSKDDMNRLYRFVWQLMWAFQWVWSNIGYPVFKVLRWPVKKLFNVYRRIWSYVVYYRDGFENLRFSKTRAGMMVVATVLVGYVFATTIVVLAFDTTMYVLTAKVDEEIYLTKSEEIDPEGNIHSVLGNSSLPLDEETGFYFRVEPTTFNHLWSLIHKGNLFYPDYVAAAVAPGLNKCKVTSYSIRAKTLMRNFDFYPKMLSASCIPIGAPQGG